MTLPLPAVTPKAVAKLHIFFHPTIKTSFIFSISLHFCDNYQDFSLSL
jgi:hypothetical protein